MLHRLDKQTKRMVMLALVALWCGLIWIYANYALPRWASFTAFLLSIWTFLALVWRKSERT